MPADEKLPLPFGRTKRWSLLGAIAVVALLLIHTLWASHARRQLDRRIAAIHARGEPILVDDFNAPSGVADEENAAIPLKKAFALTFTAAQDKWREDFDVERPLAESDKAMIRSISRANAHAFAAVREAKSRPKCDWGLTYPSPLYGMTLSALNPARMTAELFFNEALLRHSEGDHKGALELASDLLFFGEAIGAYSDHYVTHLVALGIQSQAADVIRRAAPGADDAARAQMEGLIKQLLDERELHRQMQDAWRMERAMAVDLAVNGLPMGSAAVNIPALRPMLQLDACRLFDTFEHEIDASRQTCYPAATSRLLPKPTKGGPEGLTLQAHVVSLMFRPSTGRWFVSHWGARADRRMAAILLAIRQYRLDNDGRFPPSLEDLVPSYLPVVPVDPFTPDGRPFVYLPGQIKIYSVSQDGLDQGGRDGPANRRRWDRVDCVVYLLPAPPPLPATQPEEEK